MRRCLIGAALAVALACGGRGGGAAGGTTGATGRDPGKADQDGHDGQVDSKNAAAADLVVYELQVRSANACNPDTGGDACDRKLAPQFVYHGTGCESLPQLQKIKKGTIDDVLAETDAPGRTSGITLQYVDEVVGANTVWLMPVFPQER